MPSSGIRNGSLADWVATGAVGIDPEANTTDGAEGSLVSLKLGNRTVSHGFASAVTPSYIGFWTKAGGYRLRAYSFGSPQAVAFTLSVARASTGEGLFVYSDMNNEVAVHPLVRTQDWQLIEFRNIDWSARTFDFYYDGDLLVAGAPLGSASNIGSLVFEYPNSLGDSLIDEVTVW